MSPVVRNVIKSTLLFAAAGALLALAAPVAAPLFGMTAAWGAAAYPVLWTSAFFGAFGALTATIGPVLDAVMGNKEDVAERELRKALEPSKSAAHAMEHARGSAPEYEPGYAQNAHHSYAARVQAQREQEPGAGLDF